MIEILILEPDNYSDAALSIYRDMGNVHRFSPETESLQDVVRGCEVMVIRLGYTIDEALQQRATRLKAIVSPTTGLDHIDLKAAAHRGVAVLSLKGEVEFLSTITATAELTWGLVLSLLRKIVPAHADVCNGRWDRDSFRGVELRGKTLGIVGVGRLGRMMARYGKAFHMRVLGYDPHAADGVENLDEFCGSLLELVSRSDVVTVHVPLAEETMNLLGHEHFAVMKRSALLVNTSRGRIVNEVALLEALESGKIGGAALDVLAREEDARDGRGDAIGSDLLIQYARRRDNLLLTPHIGGATGESMHRTEIFMAEKLKQHIQKKNEKVAYASQNTLQD